jgi:hypothetical protein
MGHLGYEMSGLTLPNLGAAAKRPAGQSGGLDNLSAIDPADRAFPAAVAALTSLGAQAPL